MSGGVLITGVNGYIGSRVAARLLEKGRRVIGLDLDHGKIQPLLSHPQFRFHRVDLTNPGDVPEEVRSAEVLIHCAALVHKKSRDLSPANHFRVNTEGTKNVLSFLNPARVRWIVYLSTIAVYGSRGNGGKPDETTPPSPEDAYGESKLAAEQEIRRFCGSAQVPFVIFRLAPVYGLEFLVNILKRVYLPGRFAFYRIVPSQARLSLCSIHNVLEAMLESLENPLYSNKVLILKDKRDYTLMEIVRALRRHNKDNAKILVPIPRMIPELVFSLFKIFRREKGEFFLRNLRKITQDQVFSSRAVESLGISLNWDLETTLEGRS